MQPQANESVSSPPIGISASSPRCSITRSTCAVWSRGPSSERPGGQERGLVGGLHLRRVRPRRVQEGAAGAIDRPHDPGVELHVFARDRRGVVGVRSRAVRPIRAGCRRPRDPPTPPGHHDALIAGVQPGNVAPAGQDADPHGWKPTTSPSAAPWDLPAISRTGPAGSASARRARCGRRAPASAIGVVTSCRPTTPTSRPHPPRDGLVDRRDARAGWRARGRRRPATRPAARARAR